MATRKTTTKTANRKTCGIDFKEKKCSTSKIIVLVSYLIGSVLTIITIYCAFKGYDISTLGIITSAAYAEIATGNAFYFNKAKKENALKIALSAVDKLPPEKVEDTTKIINSLGGIL